MTTRKLPARYAGIAMPFLLSIFMSCIVAGISTLKSVGLASGLFQMWMTAWGVSWLAAFPSLLVVLPVVRRIVAATVQSPQR
ncbi:DUF2798 domain-containing protein [Variovorax sp. KBS0712]|uniref:DUF2798 domain-containing protein n=1 Tax=Variovorax sp. KBS0712 TaxID=2578111 RepID=UPI00163D7755|nr:DUF2798 domain-containing protein [Variovorax sp. KBS0712]